MKILAFLSFGILSLTLFAENLGSENFESYTEGLTINELSESGVSGSSLGIWKTGASDMSVIAVDENKNHYLKFETNRDIITNEFSASENINSRVNEGDILIFESEVQFVPVDEIDERYASSIEGNDSMKFALYTYEDLNDTNVKTNLVLYHSYFDVEKNSIACTNDILMAVDDNAELNFNDSNLKHTIRIELKKFDSTRTIFSVFVDGYVMCATNGIIRSAQSLIPPDNDIIKNRTWFGTVNEGDKNEISALNLSGSGTIDNINLTHESPQALPNATVMWDKSNGKDFGVFLDSDFTGNPVSGNSMTLADGGIIYIKLADNADYHFADTTTTAGLVVEGSVYAIYTYEYSDSMVLDDDGTVHITLDLVFHDGDKATCLDCGYIPPDYVASWTLTDGTCYDGDTLLTSSSTTFEYGTTKTLTFKANGDLILGFVSVNGNTLSFEANSTSISIEVTESSTIIVRFKERPKESFAENDVIYESDGSSVTLTEAQAEWLNAIRTANGLTYEEVTERIAGETDEYTFTQEYLLNTNPMANTEVIFEVSEITVNEEGIDVEITLIRTEDGTDLTSDINGTLKIMTSSDLSNGFTREISVDFNDVSTLETQSFSTADTFFKAIIK